MLKVPPTVYEIRPTQDPLDYPAEAERVTTKQVALDMKISRRRVQQMWKSYIEGGREPQV